MNIILNDIQRDNYKRVIEELHKLCPETIQRKIPRANIQQAFVLDTVQSLVSSKSSPMLAVGSYEDTASEALKKLGYNIVEIDPLVNGYDLNSYFNEFFYSNISLLPRTKLYEIIFSTSVIEHVENDEVFIDQICKLLKPGGYGVLTCDFNNSYVQGGPKPGEDYRLYTKDDLLVRLNAVLQKNGCSIYGVIDYDHLPDFQYGIYTYSFATYVFRKAE